MLFKCNTGIYIANYNFVYLVSVQEAKMELKIDPDNKKNSTLILAGSIGLSEAEGLRSLLIKALIDTDKITIKADGVTELGVPALQLLCSAHRSALKLNKVLTFGDNCPVRIRGFMRDAGFARTTGCSLDTQGSCLWCLGG